MQEIKWFGSIARWYEGQLGEMQDVLCDFAHHGRHIVKQTREGPQKVAEVSPSYVLVQHRALVELAMEWCHGRIDRPEDLPASMALDMWDRRMCLRVELPCECVDPGDGHPVIAALEFRNSVDRSTPLLVDIQWWRKVCSNGMFGWVSGSRFRALHRSEDIVRRAERFLDVRMSELRLQQQGFQRLLDVKLPLDRVHSWIQKVMAPEWGLTDAARLWSICSVGLDGKPRLALPGMRVEQVLWGERLPVPGACAPVSNLYHVGQAASWVAGHSTRLEQQMTRMSQVWALIAPLAQAAALETDLARIT